MGKFAHEVMEEMPPDEFATWLAYYKVKDEDRKKEEKKNRNRSKQRR